jgi:hypothetical protein
VGRQVGPAPVSSRDEYPHGHQPATRSARLAGARYPGARYDSAMPRLPADLPPNSGVVLTNPDEDCSPEAFRVFVDELLAAPEPAIDSLDAAAALRALRVDANA